MATFALDLTYRQADGRLVSREEVARSIAHQFARLVAFDSGFDREAASATGADLAASGTQTASIALRVFAVFAVRWKVERRGQYTWARVGPNWLLRNVRTSLVSTYAYVNPIVAVTLGWFVLDEELTARLFVSGAIVLASRLCTLNELRKSPESACPVRIIANTTAQTAKRSRRCESTRRPRRPRSEDVWPASAARYCRCPIPEAGAKDCRAVRG